MQDYTRKNISSSNYLLYKCDYSNKLGNVMYTSSAVEVSFRELINNTQLPSLTYAHYVNSSLAVEQTKFKKPIYIVEIY